MEILATISFILGFLATSFVMYWDKKCGIKGKKHGLLSIIPIIFGIIFAFGDEKDLK